MIYKSHFLDPIYHHKQWCILSFLQFLSTKIPSINHIILTLKKTHAAYHYRVCLLQSTNQFTGQCYSHSDVQIVSTTMPSNYKHYLLYPTLNTTQAHTHFFNRSVLVITVSSSERLIKQWSHKQYYTCYNLFPFVSKLSISLKCNYTSLIV